MQAHLNQNAESSGDRQRFSRRSLGFLTLLGSAVGITSPKALAHDPSLPNPETPNGSTIQPLADSDGTKRITLTAQIVNQTLLNADGKQVVAVAYGFNGGSPGPTLVFEEGDRVAITVVNLLPEPTAIHWHGIIVPNSQDGVPDIGQPTPAIQPGGRYTYEYTIVQPAGTHMYHGHMDGAKQDMLGLTGGFIILPRNAERLRYDRDLIYWLHGWNLPQNRMGSALKDRPFTGSATDTVNSVTMQPDWTADAHNFFTMNGKCYPSTQTIDVRLRQRIRVRFFNIEIMSHQMHFHGQNFLHIAEDGVTLREPVEMNTIVVDQGKTQDILIEAINPGLWPLHCHFAHHQTNNLSSGFGGMASVVRIS